jgi:hypothetical protein
MELNALQGMSQILKSKRPDLYLELHGTTAEDKRTNAAGVISFLAERGYDIYSVEQKQTITSERPTASVITSKPAIHYHFKTGQRR